MGYLYPADYNKAIQDVSLQQIISGDRALITTAETFAQSLITSHLVQKYDTDNEFTNTQVYNPQATYYAGNRVYLDAPAYSVTGTYIEGQLCVQAGKVYQCTTPIPVAELFTPSHWTLLGTQYDLYYANYPHEVFNIQGNYKEGDHVWYKNHIYTAIIGTRYYDHETLIQFGSTNNIPLQNYYPDDPNNGSKAWKDDGIYVVPAGNLLTTTPSQTVTVFQAREDEVLVAGTTPGLEVGTNVYLGPEQGEPKSLVGWTYSLERQGFGTLTKDVHYEVSEDGRGFTILTVDYEFVTNERYILHFLPVSDQPVPVSASGLSAYQVIMTYFTKGDNRNQQMVQYMLDVMIYRLYVRIAPKNIPADRKDNYNVVLVWLENAARGNSITADIAKKQPKQGARIRWGSNIKQQNSY